MSVLFITGVSCAGKTTLGQAIMQHQEASWPDGGGNVLVRDLDEDAPARPSTAWLDWLRWRAAEELEAGRQDPDIVRVVTGIVWPLRVIESPAWAPAMADGLHVWFFLLDPRWKVLRRRLAKRAADKPKAERAELIDYNRELRLSLRLQVQAVRYGVVLPRALSLPELVDNVLS